MEKSNVSSSSENSYIMMSHRVFGDWAVPSLWAIKHRKVRGKNFQFYSNTDPFRHRPWGVAIVDDMHPRVVVKKARQAGVTEFMLGVKLIHFASLVTSTSVYTLPKWRKAGEFARDRLSPLGSGSGPSIFSSAVRARFCDWRKLLTKYITPIHGGGRSVIHVTGSWSDDLGESTAIDALYLDEYDQMRPGVISAFRKGLSSSPFGFMRIFSTPTFPGHGIDGMYQQSNKRRWFYKCNRCGYWQDITRANIKQVAGPTSLVQRLESRDRSAVVEDGTFIIACMHCRKPLDRHRCKMQWVAGVTTHAEYSGYSFSQLDYVWITADDIMRDLRDLGPGLGKFYNYDLGEPYLGDTGEIVKGWISTLINPDIVSTKDRYWIDSLGLPNLKIVAGIDWGKVSWILILAECDVWDKPAILAVYSFQDTQNPDDTWRWAIQICRVWKCDAVVADVGYGADRNPYLYKEFGGKFFACQYPAIRSTSQRPITVEPSFGPNPPPITDATSIVKIDRTSSIKAVISMLRNADFQVAALPEFELEQLDQHFRGIVIVVEMSEDGDNTPVEVAKTIGHDHYTHCLNYALIAMKWTKLTAVKLVDVEFNYGSTQNIDTRRGSGMPMYSDIGYVSDYLNDFGEY